MKNNKVYLEFAIGPTLFNKSKEVIGYVENLLDYTTYELVSSQLATYNEWNGNITYELIPNNSGLCITKISAENYIQFITNENKVSSVVIDLDSMDIREICTDLYRYSKGYADTLISVNSKTHLSKYKYLYKNIMTKEFWERLLNDIIVINKSYEWKHIELDWCILMSRDRQIDLYIKQDKNNHTLLGFYISNSRYNYFTNEIKKDDKVYNHIEDKENKITKIRMKINGIEYCIDTEDIITSTVEFFINLINNNIKSKIRMESWTELDGYILITNVETGISDILFKKDRLNDILLESNQGNITKTNTIFDKMGIIDSNELNLKSIYVYNCIPGHMQFDIPDTSKYDYAISIK